MLWGKASIRQIRRLFVLQKNRITVICDNYLAHAAPLLIECKVLKLGNMYTYLGSIFVYKLNFVFPQSHSLGLLNLFHISHNNNTRANSSNLVNTPLSHINIWINTLMLQHPNYGTRSERHAASMFVSQLRVILALHGSTIVCLEL